MSASLNCLGYRAKPTDTEKPPQQATNSFSYFEERGEGHVGSGR